MKASALLSLTAASWTLASPRARSRLEEKLLTQLSPFLAQQARQASEWIEMGDALQIARIAAVKSLSSFDASRGATFWTWCYACVRNALRDEISRTRQSRQRRGVPPEPEAEDEPGLLIGLDIETRLDLHRALATLTSGLRQVVELRYFEGLTLRQIGTRMDRSGEWARKQLARAMKQLREQLGSDFLSPP